MTDNSGKYRYPRSSSKGILYDSKDDSVLCVGPRADSTGSWRASVFRHCQLPHYPSPGPPSPQPYTTKAPGCIFHLCLLHTCTFNHDYMFWIVYPPTLWFCLYSHPEVRSGATNLIELRMLPKFLKHKRKLSSYYQYQSYYSRSFLTHPILPGTSHAFLIYPRCCCCFDNINVCHCMPCGI
ncbi:uncharacterized protein EDB91DRAFT_879644 [Suillus paluster]|uniref:uncharacterized protein n=1 Tax=Suillus paluster TaxID=48578 RepID=UPI001B87F48B|nr:uncharacterized protein EDB91DRAFT_879644 [Suillus paluster]KAG1748450.1 hypothetical protein EDB91DRAFT_879644 [Suillus paluster]